MAYIHGRNMLVMIDGTVVAAARSCSVDMTCDVKEVSSPDSGQAREYITGRTQWSVSVDYLLTAVKTPILKTGSTVTLSFGISNAARTGFTSDKVSGTAIVTQCSASGDVGSLAKGQWQFTGTGELA